MTTHRTREIANFAQTLSIEEMQLLVGCFMINMQQEIIIDMCNAEPKEFDEAIINGQEMWNMAEGMYDDFVNVSEVNQVLAQNNAFDLYELEIRKLAIAVPKEL